ncbi:MAG TPA: LysR family transcriptional regulator [Candidatus Angelobacter sp.]|jgi:LysR family transcriptional regulator for metE and metH|nr:LysR family transcriptional regulator [Candidatus Angelobacter sp.]
MEIKLEIRHLKLLAAVAETGTVTEASKRLHLTQSALSHQLRDAEERLGAPLFLRLGKRMVLTAAGETLLSSTQRVLEELAHAEKAVADTTGETRGVIRLSTESYTCYHWLPPLMADFHKKFPGVEIRINADVTAEAVCALIEGKLDVAISFCSGPVKKGLRQMALFDDEMLLTMSPKHRLAQMDCVRPEDLAGETVLIYPPRSESTLLTHVMLPAGAAPGRVIEIPLTEGLIELAAAGSGVGLLASWAVEPDVRAKKVITKSVGPHGLHRTWYAMTLKDQQHPEYLEEFLGLLKSASPFKRKRA